MFTIYNSNIPKLKKKGDEFSKSLFAVISTNKNFISNFKSINCTKNMIRSD